MAWNNGMYVQDLSSRMMITMLAIIKYAKLDAQSIIGNGHYSGNTGEVTAYDDILGHDGYRTSLTDNTSIKVMDLVDYYAGTYEFVEGVSVINSILYINNDIKTINNYPTLSNYISLDWTNTEISITSSSGTISNLTYDTVYPYIMAPKIVGSTSIINDGADVSNNENGCFLRMSADAWGGSRCGLFTWASTTVFPTCNSWMGTRFMSF